METATLTPIKCNPKAKPNKDQHLSIILNDDGRGQFGSLEEFISSGWFKENASLTAEEVRESNFWHDYYCAFITDATVSDLEGSDNNLKYLKAFLDSDYAFYDFVMDAIKEYGRYPDEETIDEFVNSNTIQYRFNSLIDAIYEQLREEDKEDVALQ